MAYYAQPQNQNYYANTGNYNPGGYISQPTPYGYPQQPQQPPPPRQQQWQQQPSPYSPIPQPPSPYSPPSPQPPPLQNNLNYGYNAPGNYHPGNPSPQNNSFNAPSTTSPMSSKPLYDENDPNAPKPPSSYGPKYESDTYQSGIKFGEKKSGGIMGSSGRKCCCIVCCILILIIIAIVIAVLLWAKPPKIDFQGVTPSPQGLPSFQLSGGGFDFNFGLNISVDNPNIVGATFTAIRATAFYPGSEVSIGGGNLTNVNIEKQANTTIDFPFTVHYDPVSDPGLSILRDILSKCGLLPGSQKQQLSIDYQLTLSFKVLAITLSPSFNRTAQINCPIPPGTNIPGLSLLGVTGA